MTGHRPWPPGKLHDDLQVGKKEVFRFGDWSIYDCTVVGGVTNAQWNSIIFHCAQWKEWRAIQNPVNVNTWIQNETVPATQGLVTHKQERVWKRCNTNMTAESNSRCPGCRAKIPDEVQGLWKMQNFDRIQELANEF